MKFGASPFRLSQWARLLALGLAGAMLLQSGPVRVFVQSAGQTLVEKPCRHHAEQMVCPRNPDGPCTCTHGDSEGAGADSESVAGASFEACNGDSAGALSPSISPLGWTLIGMNRPGPHVSENSYTPLRSSLSPQRVGDDIFRPPRTMPDVRLT